MFIPGTITSPEGAAIIELRGWITNRKPIEDGAHIDNYHGILMYDWAYDVELDPVWIDQIGSDLNQLMRVGSILLHMETAFSSDHSTSVSRPKIHVEPMSSPVNDQPEGWNYVEPPSHFWLWNPRYASNHPDHTLNVGDYIRMVGNLVSDDPHWESKDLPHGYGIASKRWGEDAIIFGVNPKENPLNPSRWTELHPPDLFEILDPTNQPKAPIETVRCLALYADNGFTDGETKQLDLDIYPSGPKPYDPWGSPDPRATVECIEMIDLRPHMTNLDRVMAKDISQFSDHVHLHVKVKGEGGWKAPGKFKAVYRVRWKPGKYEIQANITPISYAIEPGTPLLIAITAIDPYNNQELEGQALINNDPQSYPTNKSFNYTFHGQHQVVQVQNVPGYQNTIFALDLELKKYIVSWAPGDGVPLNKLINVIVYTKDLYTDSDVDARVLIHGIRTEPSDPQMPPDGFPTNTPFNFIFRRHISSNIIGKIIHPDYDIEHIIFWPRKRKEEKDNKEEKEKEEKENMKEKEEYRDTIREEFYHLKKNTHQDAQNQNNAMDSGQHFITPDERPPLGEKKKNSREL